MCTNFLLNAEDGSVINGRSMEFGKNQVASAEIVLLPKGEGQPSYTEGAESSTHRYNIIGMNAGPHPALNFVLTDGMNDQGLSCGSLWMPDSKYRTTPDPEKQSVFVAMFNNWALGTCATVAEVKEKLQSGEVVLWENGLLQKLNMIPLHFPVTDKTGDSIVVEYTNDDRTPNIYDNTVNVLTNAPEFPWQISHMEQVEQNNGQPISPYNPNSDEPGNGYGLVGTPGDPTPPGRFSKVGIWKGFAADAAAGYAPATAKDAQILAYHLLNCVDIPDGVCRYGTAEKSSGSDYSVWVVVKDLTNLEYQVRMYGSSIPYGISFSVFDNGGVKGNTAIPVPVDKLALPLEVA